MCAYTERRLSDIDQCMASIRAQRRTPDHTIIVVDNNPALFRLLAERFGTWAQVVPSRGGPGLSAARNTGLDVLAELCLPSDQPVPSTDVVVAFLDDDAVAAPDWLAELTAPFEQPDVVAVGGTITPAWPSDRPPWFPPLLDWTVGCTNPQTSDNHGELRNVFGASAAFRLAALRSIGGFPEALGRRGDNGAGCEETEVCITLRQHDPQARIVLAPDALVHHRVTPERATVRYVLRRCFAEGSSKARLAQVVGTTAATSDERSAAAAAARAMLADITGRPRRVARACVLAGGFANAGAGFAATTTTTMAARTIAAIRRPLDASR